MHKRKVTGSRKDDAGEVYYSQNVDVTCWVTKCVASLSCSEPTLCIGTFSLQDSMAAMELMDSKMDSCEISAASPMFSTIERPMLPRATKTSKKPSIDKIQSMSFYPRPPPTHIDDDFLPLPWDELTVRDAIFIAVESLVRLESMLGGASVVESIYTCLYVHSSVIEDMRTRLDPPKHMVVGKVENLWSSSELMRGTLPQHVVFATSLAIVELTELMRSIVLHGDVYEEEDFCANTYDVPIYSNGEKGSTLSELRYSLLFANEEETTNFDEEQAVLRILGFLVDLLSMASTVARVAGPRVVEVMKEAKSSIESALRQLTELRAMVDTLQASKTVREKKLLQRVFDPVVNRPLLGNSPVRKVMFLEPVKALDSLSKTISEVDSSLCDLVLKGSSLSRIRRFLDRLSKSSINILARSLIVLNLYFDEKLLGRFKLRELIVRHIQELSGVPTDVFKSRHGQMFLDRLAKPVYDSLKLRLLNRNRQRAYMEAVIIHDWSQLQQEANVIDGQYRKENGLDTTPPYISHYVLANLVELMDMHVTIGVELSLFQSRQDVAVVYWYRDFLLSTWLNSLSAMRRSKERCSEPGVQQNNSAGKYVKGRRKNHGVIEKLGCLSHDGFESLESEFDFRILEFKRSLCRGLVRFVAALLQAGFLKEAKHHFTSSEKIFEKRFEAFASIQQPPPLSYSDYVKGSDFSEVEQADLLFATAECFKTSKTTISRLLVLQPLLEAIQVSTTNEELSQAAKVCVGNSVYVEKTNQYSAAADQCKQPSVAFDFTTHSEFCILKLL